ncbi:hypothetical protein FOA52_001667 [Chlamydomonas sp. UWO 241]|nr:hypothetical protein FOA52_001667 [Chlamydomonas sp. UWO 241]
MECSRPPHQGQDPTKKIKWRRALLLCGVVAATAAAVAAAVIRRRDILKSRTTKGAAAQERKAKRTLLLRANHYDIVLSSGFLAFPEHAGFLEAVERRGLSVGGVMGTSAGALTGALYCAGYTPQEVVSILCRDAPIRSLSPCAPWEGGLLSFDGLVEQLRELLPPRFEDLPREFAVGVVDASGRHHIIDSGPLPEAVAASAAIPLMFKGVAIPGREHQGPFKDGGMVDRVGLAGWRQRRRVQLSSGAAHGVVPPALVHVIQRSSPFSGDDDVAAMARDDNAHVRVFYSPKSGKSLLSMGDVQGNFSRAVSRVHLDSPGPHALHEPVSAAPRTALA